MWTVIMQHSQFYSGGSINQKYKFILLIKISLHWRIMLISIKLTKIMVYKAMFMMFLTFSRPFEKENIFGSFWISKQNRMCATFQLIIYRIIHTEVFLHHVFSKRMESGRELILNYDNFFQTIRQQTVKFLEFSGFCSGR